MNWEFSFLDWLTQANQNPSLNWLSWILNILTLSCDKGLIWIAVTFVMLFFKKWRKTGIILAFALVVFAMLGNNIIIKYSVQRIRPLYVSSNPISYVLLDRVSDWMLPSGSSFFRFL